MKRVGKNGFRKTTFQCVATILIHCRELLIDSENGALSVRLIFCDTILDTILNAVQGSAPSFLVAWPMCITLHFYNSRDMPHFLAP
jgi:hypothetical protein